MGYKALRTTAKAPQTINKADGIAKASTPPVADGKLAAAVPVPGAALFAAVAPVATPVPVESVPTDANTCDGIEPASAANAAGVMTLE